MTTEASRRFRHEAAIYWSDDELLAVAVPFLRDGVDTGVPTLVGLEPREQDLVLAALGDTDGIIPLGGGHYADPFRALEATHRLLTDQVSHGATPVRVLGQVPNHATGTEWGRWVRYESAINDLYAELDVWSICPYDARRTDPAVLADVERTHTHLASLNGDRGPNEGFVEPTAFLADRARQDIDPLEAQAPHLACQDPSPSDARRAIATLAATTQLDSDTVERLVLAVSELVTNATMHGRPPVELAAWASTRRVVATVHDHGPGPDDPLAGYMPRRGDPVGGLGLWMVNQACSGVAMRRVADGFTVQVTAGTPPTY